MPVIHLITPVRKRFRNIIGLRDVTWCGRKLDQQVGSEGEGVEVFINGVSRVLATRDEKAFTCQRCRKHFGPLI